MTSLVVHDQDVRAPYTHMMSVSPATQPAFTEALDLPYLVGRNPILSGQSSDRLRTHPELFGCPVYVKCLVLVRHTNFLSPERLLRFGRIPKEKQQNTTKNKSHN